MPACASVILKSLEISISNPIGINSEVLKINAEIVIPTSVIQCFSVNAFSILFLIYQFYKYQGNAHDNKFLPCGKNNCNKKQ